ncbi:YihY/virulence factor BrkB family protein [Pseudoruegeria sp. SK021]|uniref:YihY/virulence factor BrkB family protein n=1 Tax=Pseudoruegeria sp. SK021 TaxID=1933035 RepID=UPI000A2600DE|nr:YihY/virulence factor BrkB family protein [Pseudoruegeria sp. SK021]OSP54614.1 hypothetical protein BV911_11460 [Pseudoruegeria sp. SK021]
MNRRITSANVPLVAAGGAFFTMLSMFPGLAAFVALLGFFVDPTVVDDQLALLKDFVPADAFDIIATQVRQLASTNTSTLGWATAISTIAALWSARRGTDALIKAVNAVYDAPMRGGIRAAVTALAITFAMLIVGLVAILSLVVLPIILAFLPLGDFTSIIIGFARWAVALLVVFSGIWVVYRFSPNIPDKRMPWITPGSILAVLVWGGASWGFSYYLTNFGAYNEVYGSIGAVVALLMFLYITIFIVLLGATLNAELSQSTGVGVLRSVAPLETTPEIAPPVTPELPQPEHETPVTETNGKQT